MRHQEESLRMEELHNQVQKRKQLELRQEEERGAVRKMRWQQEETMLIHSRKDSREPSLDAREQEIWMGQMPMGGATGINNRGACPLLLCQLVPSSSRTSHYDARWNLRIDPTPTTERFGQAVTMEKLGHLVEPPALNCAAPEAEFAPKQTSRY